MKKHTKVFICVIVILLSMLFHFVRYDTRGITIGTAGRVHDNLTGNYIGYNDFLTSNAGNYSIYPNRFGRIVLVESSSKAGNALSESLAENWGSVVFNIQTIPGNGVATHWDFLSLSSGHLSLGKLLKSAGMPVTTAKHSLYDFLWKTVDGYTFEVGFSSKTGLATRCLVFTPEGENITFEEYTKTQWQIRFFYLGLAAVLSVILVCLLVIPNKLRKRKQTA